MAGAIPEVRDGVDPQVKAIRERGVTLRQIAQELNERHIKTCNNRSWYPATVNRLLLDGQENSIKS